MLEADYYESTGDFRAVELLDSMQILQRRDEVRQIPAQQIDEFRRAVGALRVEVADQIETTQIRTSVVTTVTE